MVSIFGFGIGIQVGKDLFVERFICGKDLFGKKSEDVHQKRDSSQIQSECEFLKKEGRLLIEMFKTSPNQNRSKCSTK